MMWILWPFGVGQLYRSIMVSILLLVRVSLADEVFVPAVEHQLAALMIRRGAHDDHAGGALLQALGDFQRRIRRITGIHALEIADRMRPYRPAVCAPRSASPAACRNSGPSAGR